MTKIPPDDILEELYKLRIRESEKLQTVLELYDLGDSSEKKQDLTIRNENYERNAVVENQGDKTAWTKNSWRLLAMGSQRAVF